MMQANTTSEYLEQVKALTPEARAALEEMFKGPGQPIASLLDICPQHLKPDDPLDLGFYDLCLLP